MPNIQPASSNASSGNLRGIEPSGPLSASQTHDSGKVALVVKQVNDSVELLSSWEPGSEKKTSPGRFSEIEGSVLRPTVFSRGAEMQRLQESKTSALREKKLVQDEKPHRESTTAEITSPEKEMCGELRLVQYFKQHAESCAHQEKDEMGSRRRAAKVSLPALSESKIQKLQNTGGHNELGRIVAGGVRGIIYQHSSDDAFVIKRLKRRTILSNDELQNFPKTNRDDEKHFIIPFDRRLKDAKEEAALFQEYYGAGSAEVQTDEADVYIKMLKIPGRPLGEVRQFRANAIERYADMLECLNKAGIMHGDLHGANVLYYAKGNCFFPVDFSNIRTHYFFANKARKKSFNVMGEILWQSNIERIRKRIVPEPQRP